MSEHPLQWSHVIAVAAGGAVGCVLRYFANFYSTQLFGPVFPWGTLAVNIFGSLWIGFFGTIALERPGLIDPSVRFLLTTGFAGGLTTFSALAFETLSLQQQGQGHLALMNIAANVVFGVLAAFLGILLAKGVVYLFQTLA